MIDEVEPEPPAAKALAGEGLDQLREFAHDLAVRGELLGLIGPGELPRLWTRHILNCALLAAEIPSSARVADIGSGAGLPGIVLAVIRPDLRIELIEPMERRCTWLSEQVANLELTNATVKRGRAEEFHGAFEVDVVTARAVSALRTLVPIAAPLAKHGGELLFLKGASVEQELAGATKALRRYQVSDVRIDELGVGVLHEGTRVFRGRVRASHA